MQLIFDNPRVQEVIVVGIFLSGLVLFFVGAFRLDSHFDTAILQVLIGGIAMPLVSQVLISVVWPR